MSNTSRSHPSNERLAASLKIAAFVTVAGFVVLSANPPNTAHSGPGMVGVYDDPEYAVTAFAPPPAAPVVAAKVAAPFDYFPAQFENKGANADSSVPTF